ncbi:MAG: PhnD/SsuA/transferrin family substrate-binding protein [Methylococcaceae bacterium]
MNYSKLQIQPQPSTEALSQQFNLTGTVDVDAVAILETLYVLPPNCGVELNFAQVQRVNSMGLAQLLKLFEHWQKHNIKIRVTDVNRMIGVLFKMTGLTRFMSDEQVSIPVSTQSISSEQPSQQSAIVYSAASSGILQIQPQPSTEALSQQFNLTGTVDVDAVAILETLYILPPNCAVELNFAQVQRVNSMGLAQLLKLFEHWQKRSINIHITNANRMIGVLFKMTGLTRFMSDGQSTASAGSATPTKSPQSQEAKQSIFASGQSNFDPTMPVQSSPLTSNIDSTMQGRRSNVVHGSDKLNLWVSAQSSQQMNGWYFFNTYLQRHLGREVHMELTHGAMNERRKSVEQMDMVFTKPFEATSLMIKHNFHPLLRPIDQTDEVTLLARADDPRQNLADFEGGKIVTAAQDNFVYLLGRFLLEEDEAALANMEYLFTGHDIKALQTLLKGSADILFMLSETYRGLSGLTKKMLREIDQSETAFAFHLFCVAPQFVELGNTINEVLLDMSLDSQGRQVLGDLGIEGWCKPAQDEIAMLEMLFNRYA